MIILDTNQLRQAQPPDGPLLSILQAIAKQADLELALPEIALEEHLAKFGQEIRQAHKAARDAVRTLEGKVPGWRVGDLPNIDVSAAMEMHAKRLMEIFRILPTPEGVFREAFLREIRRLPPASNKWDRKGEGARDAAIWLTAVNKCQQLKGQSTYFVSLDKPAFGDGQLLVDLEKDLKNQLGENISSFHYCCGINVLLGQLATKYPTKLKQDAIGTAEPVLQALRTTLAGGDVFTDLLISTGLTGEGHVVTRIGSQTFDLANMKSMEAYTVGDDTWASGRLEWQIIEEMSAILFDVSPNVVKDIRVAFELSTTMLMKLDNEGQIIEANVTSRGSLVNVEPKVLN